MKTIITPMIALASLLFCTGAYAQTTAMNFTGQDCNGNNVDLFSDLDAEKAVMLIFYMPNCGSCPPVATKMQTMANNINNTYPGLVKAYSFPYQNSTICSSSANWVINNDLTLFTPMDSGAVQVAYYGGFGMPTVVLLGGNNHDVLFVTQDFNTSDTTTMRDLILNTFTAGLNEPVAQADFTTYPNPVSDLLYIRFTATGREEIELINLDGKTIKSLKTAGNEKGDVEKTIDVSGIPAGEYLVKVSSGNSVNIQKVQIVH
jgi:hypothetical protein